MKTIPASATAKVSLRLVPGLPFVQVAKWLEKAAKAAAPKWAEVDLKILHGGDAVEVDTSHPAFAVLDEAFKEIVGKPTVRVRAGGSIPIVPRIGSGGAPVLLRPSMALGMVSGLHVNATVFGHGFLRGGGAARRRWS